MQNIYGAEKSISTSSWISDVLNDTRWLTPATQKEFTDSKLGAFSLFTDTKKLLAAPFNVLWPPLMTGLIITMLISILSIGSIIGCWVGDVVFPNTNKGWFTLETLAMAFGSAALVFVFRYTRSSTEGRPPWSETIAEFFLLAAKFGILHLFFQFTGFYSWAFPDSALGGCLTTEWEGKGLDKIKKEKDSGVDTSAHSIYNENELTVHTTVR